MKWLTVFFGITLATFAFAQEQPAEEPTAQAETKQVETKQAEKAPKKSSGKTADNYRPTEEISEDLSVSYPVDI